MDRRDATMMLKDRINQILDDVIDGDLYGARWGAATLADLLEQEEILFAFNKCIIQGATIMERRMVDLLDRLPYPVPGKFEGESEAAPYLWERISECEDDYAHEGFGYYAFYVRTVHDPLEFPCYTVWESAETGHATIYHYDTLQDGREAWSTMIRVFCDAP